MTETHYELHCYVCGPSCTQPTPFEGWATFPQIFNHRPNDCRYAVVKDTTGAFLVWDLYHDIVTRPDLRVSERSPHVPPPKWTCPTADAAVMKAMMLYER